MPDLFAAPHRRYNPLTREWLLVSPHRAERPWLGEHLEPQHPAVPPYDPACYLCPGNVRANGERNPQYENIYVFTNDFPALLPQTPQERYEPQPFVLAQSERGTCRVLCFSPRHDLHVASLPLESVVRVVDAWAAQYAELCALPYVDAVTIFENRGAAMGASNPHPHGQIWANESVPTILAAESASLEAHAREHGACLLCAYAEFERADGSRLVYADEHVTVVVPFWAVWPFETLVMPRRHAGTLQELDAAERAGLARAMKDLLVRYDRLFGVTFPYSMGFHQRPCRSGRPDVWHAHAHYMPPLLRSATVRKYMVGYEMLAQPQRDVTAEQAAARLREP